MTNLSLQNISIPLGPEGFSPYIHNIDYIRMRKNLATIFVSSFIFAWSLLTIPISYAEDDIEYRFELYWPRLEQPWYFNKPADIAIASDSSLYIADSKNNRIMHFSANGEFIRSWGNRGSKDGSFRSPEFLTTAPNGDVYVADTANNRIQQFSAEGEFIRKWGNEGSGEGQFQFPKGIAIAPDGSVYVADYYNHRIQQFSSTGDFIRILGSYGSKNGQLVWPHGLDFASDGSFYVADRSNRRIQQFSAEGKYIRKWGAGRFEGPLGIAIGSDDSVYTTDGSSIQQFNAAGEFIGILATGGSEDGQVDFPHGLDIASDGSIYVADFNNDRIQKFSAKGDFIRSWESSGSDDGQLDAPTDLAIAFNGSAYVIDSYDRIQQFDPEGNFIRSWGNRGSKEGEFNSPQGLSIAPSSDIYVADTGNNRIQQFNAVGELIRIWGEKGTEEGQFREPQSIVIGHDGSVYVADTNNHRIQQFSSEGNFIRAWGRSGSKDGQFRVVLDLAIAPDGSIFAIDDQGFTDEGHRTQQFSAQGDFIQRLDIDESGDASFSQPAGLTITPDGTIHIVSYTSNRVRKFSAEGSYIGSFGSAGYGNGQFLQPQGLAAAPDGSLFIADTGYNRIQKFVPQLKTNIVSAMPNGVTITHPYKAIVLAGGGKTIGNRTNHIWDGTWRITQKAYKALSRQAFIIHDEIKFLTAGSTQFDLDNNNKFDDLEVASKDSLRLAITEWAADAKDVVIFLANHGGPGKFQVNSSEILTGEELNSWVNQLDDIIPGTVTVIIEACNSASFFNSLSKSKRNLFASAKADQPAVISNDGLSSFSYFFWSEIGTGAYLQEAFSAARKGMSPIIINGIAQDAQADTDGDQRFTRQDLDSLGDYCLGNCNQTAAAAPVISPIKPNSRTLNGEMTLDFSVQVAHLQALNKVWALVQRPDDISIDPNQPLNFEKITLDCDSQDNCHGRYEHFDLAGEYQLSIYAMDADEEVSLPETLSITQTQGNEVIPAVYDDQLAVVYLRDVLVNGQHLQAALELQGDKFIAIAFSDAPKQYSQAAQFDLVSGILSIPFAQAFGQDYQATFKYRGNLEFELISAKPK